MPGALFSGLTRLGRIVEGLEQRLEALEQENAALQTCLVDHDLLRPEALHARLHRSRFTSFLKKNPVSWEASFADLIVTRELRTAIGRYVGWPTLRRCSGLNRSLRILSSEVPQVVYVCGGFDGQQILASVMRFNPRGFLWNAPYTTAPQADTTTCGACMNRKEPMPLTNDLMGEQMGVWENMAPMIQKRAGFSAAVDNGLLYACGGYDGSVFLRSAECYTPDIDQGVWTPVAPMSELRHCAAAAALGRRIYVCGGFNGTEALRSVECYDPVRDIWESAPSMDQRRHGASAAVLEGKLYVCGGYNGEQALRSTERFDPEVGRWEPVAPLLQPRNVAFCAVFGGQLHICSGCNGLETLSTTERFDPVASVWVVGPSMPQKRHGAAAAVADGRLYICGGGESAESPGRILESVDRFDPCVQAWSEATPMACGGLAAPRIDMAVCSMFAPM